VGKKRQWNYRFFTGRSDIVAYWAGFMMADGNICKYRKSSYSLAVFIHKDDIDHMKQFAEDIGLGRDGIYIRKDGCGGVRVSDIHLGDDLRVWGIVPRKTYNFVEPQISDALIPHYLRGWADGDGHIYIGGNGARFTVSGNPDAIRWYANALIKLGFDGDIGFQDRSETISILYIGGKRRVRKILDLLLVDGNFKLERKWNKSYNAPNPTIYSHKCEQCGKNFMVSKYRHEQEINFGRFCSRKCLGMSQRKQVINGKTQCARCKQWFDVMSGNTSYCKQCWRKMATERRRKIGMKAQHLREKRIINGIEHTKCPKCHKFVSSDEIKSTYCKSCQADYMREYRAKKKKRK